MFIFEYVRVLGYIRVGLSSVAQVHSPGVPESLTRSIHTSPPRQYGVSDHAFGDICRPFVDFFGVPGSKLAGHCGVTWSKFRPPARPIWRRAATKAVSNGRKIRRKGNGREISSGKQEPLPTITTRRHNIRQKGTRHLFHLLLTCKSHERVLQRSVNDLFGKGTYGMRKINMHYLLKALFVWI